MTQVLNKPTNIFQPSQKGAKKVTGKGCIFANKQDWLEIAFTKNGEIVTKFLPEKEKIGKPIVMAFFERLGLVSQPLESDEKLTLELELFGADDTLTAARYDEILERLLPTYTFKDAALTLIGFGPREWRAKHLERLRGMTFKD